MKIRQERTLRESDMDLIYMGSRNRQDLLSKLGVGESEARKGGEQRKIYSSIKAILKKKEKTNIKKLSNGQVKQTKINVSDDALISCKDLPLVLV